MSVKVYIVMAPPPISAADDGGQWEAENIVFVKDGFSLPALIIPDLWLIWHRMWIPLLGYLGYRVLIGLTALALGEAVSAPIAILLAFLFALEANNLRCWSLDAKGWRIVGESIGRNRNEAEFLFFRDRAGNPAVMSPGVISPGVISPGVMGNTGSLDSNRRDSPVDDTLKQHPADDEPNVFGLFPDPEPGR